MRTITITLALIITTIINVSAQFSSIQVEVKGKGEPVLLLPGFTCPGDVWNETVAEISENRECHIVTYAGFGDVPAIDTLWLKTIKQDLEKYIKQKNLKNLSIVGHSMGGTLSLWMASEQNQAISDILIIDALPCMGAVMMPNYSSENITYDNPYNQNLLKMSEEDFNGMASNFANFMCMNPEGKKRIIDWMNQSDRKTYVYGYTDLLKLDLRNDISKVNARVKILAATFPNKTAIEQNLVSSTFLFLFLIM